MKYPSYILLVFCLFLFSNQTVRAQRYLPGQQGIQLTTGMVDGKINKNNYLAGFLYSKYTKSENHIALGTELLNYSSSYKKTAIPVSQITVESGYYFHLFSDRKKNIFFSLGPSLMLGYETINWGEKKLSDGSIITDRDRFIYGGTLGLEIEGYITDRIVLLLNLRERLLWGSDTSNSNLRNQISFGIKYILE